ncbi:IS4/Tn5 family transposase DNA-binding protein [Cerasicoccus maritimus]|uniref:IS4/Tn5 family transposase DNA-binding protein n=1 Tax=Cerasicoccus maritimus TaxID=490089 RepID=UPI002852A80E|nr:tyrosine-type recombinase/integrase [Cerasicoccus maritimus]
MPDVSASQSASKNLFSASSSWIEHELSYCSLKDERLTKRFKTILQQLHSASAESIPWACQDWANAKAAYRFFDNDRVSDTDILAGHFRSTSERFASTPGTVLVLQDTTEFSFQRENIGLLHKPRLAQNAQWREKHPLCGLSMHSSLVVTTGGLPLGLAAARFWTRNKFKGANALKRKINPTRVPIEQKESMRWLLNLRESTSLLPDLKYARAPRDYYELFRPVQGTLKPYLDGKLTFMADANDFIYDSLHCEWAYIVNLDIRSAELCKLSIFDIDLPEGMLTVRQGKGRKDRIVPLGKAAREFLREYLERVRPILWKMNQGRCAVERLFFTNRRTPLRPDGLLRIVRKYQIAAGLPPEITTHSFRHTCATEMLKGGASVRHVQEMLGHSSMETTQIYTRIVPTDLKAMHQKTAPSEAKGLRRLAKPVFTRQSDRDWGNEHKLYRAAAQAVSK